MSISKESWSLLPKGSHSLKSETNLGTLVKNISRILLSRQCNNLSEAITNE